MSKVSIVIPLHNNADFIAEALRSCLNQTYANIEVVVVENGSKDQSYERAMSIKDARLQVYQIDKANAASARNFGYKKTTGDYITFMDADDILSENKIELQVAELKQQPTGYMSSCPWAKFTNKLDEAVITPQRVWEVNNPIDWCLHAWTGGGMMIPACWLIPRVLIEKAGLWNEDLSLHDDGEFMCRVLLASKGNCFVNNTVVYYRQVPTSLSRQNFNFKAASSALAVYKSYETSILAVDDTITIRKALAYNYLRFIYEFYPNHNILIQKAQKYLMQLNVHHLPQVGGKNFKILAKLVGFNTALKLKRMFK